MVCKYQLSSSLPLPSLDKFSPGLLTYFPLAFARAKVDDQSFSSKGTRCIPGGCVSLDWDLEQIMYENRESRGYHEQRASMLDFEGYFDLAITTSRPYPPALKVALSHGDQTSDALSSAVADQMLCRRALQAQVRQDTNPMSPKDYVSWSFRSPLWHHPKFGPLPPMRWESSSRHGNAISTTMKHSYAEQCTQFKASTQPQSHVQPRGLLDMSDGVVRDVLSCP